MFNTLSVILVCLLLAVDVRASESNSFYKKHSSCSELEDCVKYINRFANNEGGYVDYLVTNDIVEDFCSILEASHQCIKKLKSNCNLQDLMDKAEQLVHIASTYCTDVDEKDDPEE